MTRKDYVLIANALRWQRSELQANQYLAGSKANLIQGVDLAANAISERLAADNPRFDREHFLAAVRGQE